MANIKTERKESSSSFRKLAIGAWKKPSNPSIYGKVVINYSPCEQFLTSPNYKHISSTHIITKAFALVIKKYPELNRVLIRRSIYQRQAIKTFIQTHIQDKQGPDLSGITIENPEQKSLTDLQQEIQEKTSALKKKQNKAIEKSRTLVRYIPNFFMSTVVNCFDFIMYSLNINLSKLGFPQDPYGTFMLTSIGSLGIEEGYIPLFPFSRCGILIAVGKPYTSLKLNKNKEITEQTNITLSFTLDHRYLDGAHLAKPLAYLKKILKSPETYLVN